MGETVSETLGRRAVHVWLYRLSELPETAPAELDEAERARAAGFAFEEDRRRFVAARACLRRTCSRYVADRGGAVVLEYENGRPVVAGGRLACNLSHSGDLIAVAVARHAVGIDVEQLRGDEPDPALVTRVCTPAERQRLEQAPPEERERIFLSQWVRREALGKALGIGLDLDLRPRALTAFPRAGGVRHGGWWRVHALVTPDGYVGAVAARGAATRLLTRRNAA